MKKAYMMIGLPGAGKSTWVNNADELWEDDSLYVVSTDNVIDKISIEYGFTYDETFTQLISFAQKVFDSDFEWCIKEERTIVIDRTNTTPKIRKTFIDKLTEAGYEVHAVFFTIDIATQERRLAQREGKHIPDFVLRKMRGGLVSPSIEEGFSSITVVNA